MRGSLWEDEANATSTSTPHPRVPPHETRAGLNYNHSGCNVFRLLARREVSPRTKNSTKRQWGETSKEHLDSIGTRFEAVRDAKRGLISWVEAESLRNLSAKYCSLLPPPRSTIAAAFSHDGKTIASTHGDHTVKIIDCQTGSCLKALRGHRRTPWVVRFHPLCSEIVASGSLDHEVRLWNANTAECIGSRDFYRPIASLAFHAHGELLAVASGHKLYVWHYDKKGEASSPTVLLRTRRSLRAVHFHPCAFPFLLTAEVNDLDLSDSSVTLATSPGYLRYPPPTIYLADVHTVGRASLVDELPITSLPLLMGLSLARDDGRISIQHTDRDVVLSSVRERVDPSASVRLLTYSTPSGQYELLLSPVEQNSSSPVPEETGADSLMNSLMNEVDNSAMDTAETPDVQHGERNNHLFSFGIPTNWELPFLQGWLVGQSQAGQRRLSSLTGFSHENLAANAETDNLVTSSAMPINFDQPRVTGRSNSRHRSLRSHTLPGAGFRENSALNYIPHGDIDTQPHSRIQSELVSSVAAAAAAAELPCTVKLRIWSHDIRDPCAPLDEKPCRLTIPHAVLCSEMGAHFSPCGRFLAACVACVLPHLEGEPGLQSMVQNDFADASTSPTRHPILSRQVVYELRVYSLEEATFGTVLVSRAIRAAHCLTSIQFSPSSEHLLLAYGRRHRSLLKSVVIDGETTVPIYTILEVYRVSDMELVRVLSSAEDEVNVACFHPSVGGGLVYGTKEGKLRILQFESCGMNLSSSFLEENMLEVPTYALEC